jgi:hypothetical protein
MFKTIKLLTTALFLSSLVSFGALANSSQLDLSYNGSGVVSFNEPFDIASYQVYYAQNLDIQNQIYLSDLSKCPSQLGLFCISKSISRSGNTVYLNLKDNMKDTVFTIAYKNTNGQASAPSNLINIKKQIDDIEISAFSDSQYLYFEVFNTQEFNLNKFSFDIYYKNQDLNISVDEFDGCRNYVYVEQSKCVARNLESIGKNMYRVDLKDAYKYGYEFVIAFKDSHSNQTIYSNVVYIKNQNSSSIKKISKIENLKVNDRREIFFDLMPSVNKYFVSYSKQYPNYSPTLSDMDFCIMEDVASKCSVESSYTNKSRVYMKIRPDLDAGFFVVYYEDLLGRISPLSRPVYVKASEQNYLNSNLSSINIRQSAVDEIAFKRISSAKKYYLVHTYGDKVGYLYHSDFPGCKYSGLNCAGYNIREVFDSYYIKIRPEKTGNRFAIYYEDFSGNISALSNSIFIPRANMIDQSKLVDINFTEYFEAISALHSRGIVNGYTDNTFRPFQKINRAEFVKIAMEAHFPEIHMFNPNYSCFSDVSVNDWFNKYGCFAKQKGIISGYMDDTFRPSQSITLAEALKVSLYSSGGFVQPPSDYVYWYSPFLDTARNSGLLPLSILNKNADYLINRGEMAYITYKILNN